MSHAELTTVTPHTQGWVGDEEEDMAMPLPGDIAIQAPGDLGQAPWARWPRAGPGVAVGSHRLHGAPGAGLSCGGSWEGNDSQGDMVPSAVRRLVAVTRGSVVTSQT